MSELSAAPRAAVSVSNARAEASRQNGAKSRGPKTEEGKARSAQNALKHGMRAQKHLVLPDEDGAEFAALETALVEELAPVGGLQTVLARRVAVAAWRLARADRIEAELFEERRVASGGLGLALIRDGNGPRSFETLLRYRGAAMTEFWRALRTLKALQAEQSLRAEQARATATGSTLEASIFRPAARSRLADRVRPNEPERRTMSRLDYLQARVSRARPARARSVMVAERTRGPPGAPPRASAPQLAPYPVASRSGRGLGERGMRRTPNGPDAGRNPRCVRGRQSASLIAPRQGSSASPE